MYSKWKEIKQRYSIVKSDIKLISRDENEITILVRDENNITLDIRFYTDVKKVDIELIPIEGLREILLDEKY